jgi:hypothetical protein
MDSDSIGSGVNPIAVTYNLTGLNNNSLYYYRVAASSSAGTSYGSIQTLSTGPDLTLTASHTGEPWGYGTSGQYVLSVKNVGATTTSGVVTLRAMLPAGLSIKSLTGSGWTANVSDLSCTRSDILAAGASYPPIALEVSVDANATRSLLSSFAVSGGGDLNPANNTASDLTSTIGSLDSWRKQWFGSSSNTGLAADTSSYAGDGVANLVKYALGLDPTSSVTGGLPEGKIVNHRLALTFQRLKSATDIVYEVQATGDLFGWDNATVIWSSAFTAYSGGANESESVTVQDTVSTGATNRRFMRLQITRP